MFNFEKNIENLINGNKEHYKILLELKSNICDYAESLEKLNEEEEKEIEDSLKKLETGLNDVVVMLDESDIQKNALVYIKQFKVKIIF
jgi:hypothetical protein